MQDIRTKIAGVSVDIRACGLLRNGDDYLVSTENDGTQTLHGGAIKVGETTEDAVVREFFEETALQVTSNRLLALIENHFCINNQPYQQLLFVYDVHLSDPTKRDPKSENGCTSQWLPKEQVTQLRPAILNELVHQPFSTFTHIINQEPAFIDYLAR
ncbi:NUDIX hydrolase [Enterococcus italicus]